MQKRFLTMHDLKELTGLGASTIYREIKAGRFPAPLHPLGHMRTARWVSSEVEAWQQSCVEEAAETR